MFSIATLWIPFAIIASLGQVARNAMQRSLTGPLGTWGATNIRFLFGFPFSVMFFVAVILATGDAVPWPTAAFWPWLVLGALAQIVGIATLIGFVLPLTYALNWLLNRFVPQRVAREGERQGLDLYELGAGAYPEFLTHSDEFLQR